MFTRHQLLAFTMGALAVFPAMAQDSEESSSTSGSVATNYVGDNYRIGIGYGTETDLTGEFFWSFAEKPESAWIAEGWLGNGGAAGLKLNYHWLANGVQAGLDENDQAIYSDGVVRKVFLAADQNEFDDRKLSFGFGSEKEHRFWSVYGSKSLSGERFIGQSIDLQDILVNGVIDNHNFTRTDTLQTITDFFAHPYDWGAGARLGKYFDQKLVRARLGVDYEWGDYDTSQITAFASLEKRFQDSQHGISLRAEALRKHGDFEIDKNDVRVTAFWTYDFGSTFSPVSETRSTQVERMPTAEEMPTEEVTEVIQNQVTLDNATSFELNKAELNKSALDALSQVVSNLSNTRIAGNIQIIGHTCSLGTDEYNQGLSERRARSVVNFLTGQGVDPDMLSWEGRGEREPRYSNETEESRKRNRRVEITFTSEEEVTRRVPVGEAEPIVEWVEKAVPVEAAWIRRALRNPVMHKRSVDYYRVNRVTENTIEGVPVIENTGPMAVDDMFSVDQNSSENPLAVLLNDSDGEGDGLTIVSITRPSNGTAFISGEQVIYTPDIEFFGNDSFSYTVDDGYGATATASVTIVVQRLNAAPLAVDDQFTVNGGSGGNRLDVLGNDSDPDGDSLTIVSVASGAHGTATLSGDVITYVPGPGFLGIDTFHYTIEDSLGLQATAMVTVTVVEGNFIPVAEDDFAVTAKNTAVIIDVLANDSDQDGDPLTIIEIIQAANKMGIVTINGDGTVTYDPMPGWWGGDMFQYVISDGRGGTATATVVLDVQN